MTVGATEGRFHRLLSAGACGVATSNSNNMRRWQVGRGLVAKELHTQAALSGRYK